MGRRPVCSSLPAGTGKVEPAALGPRSAARWAGVSAPPRPPPRRCGKAESPPPSRCGAARARGREGRVPRAWTAVGVGARAGAGAARRASSPARCSGAGSPRFRPVSTGGFGESTGGAGPGPPRPKRAGRQGAGLGHPPPHTGPVSRPLPLAPHSCRSPPRLLGFEAQQLLKLPG